MVLLMYRSIQSLSIYSQIYRMTGRMGVEVFREVKEGRVFGRSVCGWCEGDIKYMVGHYLCS